MFINLDKLLKSRNKSMLWLSKETGITYANINKLCNNKTNAINFDILERICLALGCSPSDILIVQPKD